MSSDVTTNGEKSPWSFESISASLKAKYYKNKKWGMYGAHVAIDSAFTVFFANMASAFLGPYELIVLAAILAAEAFRTTQELRRASIKAFCDDLGWSEKTANRLYMAAEFVATGGVFAAIIAGTILGVGAVIAASPFIFLGVMGYRVAQSLYYAGKNLGAAYKAYQEYKKLDSEVSFLNRLGQSMGKRIRQFFGFSPAKVENINNVDPEASHVLLPENDKPALSLQQKKQAAWEAVKAPLKAAAFNIFNAAVFSMVGVAIAYGFGVIQAVAAVVSPLVITATALMAGHTLVTIANGPAEGKGVEMEMVNLEKSLENKNTSVNDITNQLEAGKQNVISVDNNSTQQNNNNVVSNVTKTLPTSYTFSNLMNHLWMWDKVNNNPNIVNNAANNNIQRNHI